MRVQPFASLLEDSRRAEGGNHWSDVDFPAGVNERTELGIRWKMPESTYLYQGFFTEG